MLYAQYNIEEITTSMVKLRVLTESDLTVDDAGLMQKNYEWGSGFYISEDGLILTAFHVIENASKSHSDPITCFEPNSGDSRGVWLVYHDKQNDIALLQNEKYTGNKRLKNYINILGRASDLKLGISCFCIGFPNEILNYKNSYAISPGVLKAIDKNVKGSDKIPWRRKLLVAECEINSGFSGGLVFDKELLPVGIIIGMYSEGENKVFALIKRVRDIRIFLKESNIENN